MAPSRQLVTNAKVSPAVKTLQCKLSPDMWTVTIVCIIQSLERLKHFTKSTNESMGIIEPRAIAWLSRYSQMQEILTIYVFSYLYLGLNPVGLLWE